MKGLLELIGFLSRAARLAPRPGGGRRWALAAVMVTGILGGLASTGLIAVINDRLNRPATPLSALVWIFAGLCLVLSCARFISQSLLARLVQDAVFDLRMQLARRILAVPLRHLEELGPHRLLAVLTDDVTTISNTLGTIPLLCIQLSVVISCLIYLGWLSWPLLLLTLLAVLVGVVTYQVPTMRASLHFNQVREEWNALFKHLRGLTEGTKELKLHRRRRQDFLDGSLAATAGSLRRHNVQGETIYALANSWGQILFFVLIGILLFAVPGLTPVSARTLTGFTLVILYMMTPLDVIMNLLPAFNRAQVSVRQVRETGLSLEGQPREATAADGPAPPWQQLELAGVTHAYRREGEDSSFTLGPIDLLLVPGELVFVVGGNGSGKTTLAKLITGLYIPENGGILLDGQPITDATRDRYRQLFSVVFADFFLFENLLGLRTPGLDSQAASYLRQLRLERNVRVENGALSTVDLSTGQRKRLALLTAYLEDRPIYLFDEWAADQDPQFKELFYLELLPELKRRRKTVIVISHDDRYYRVGDRVVRLEDGRLEYDRSIGRYLAAVGADGLAADAAARPAAGPQ